MRSSESRGPLAFTAAIGLALVTGPTVQAHRPVTSPYSYNEHVYPILRDHCGQCHVDGGAAPMSLLVYQDPMSGGAAAWAQAIRETLVEEAMPPWYADPTGPPVVHPRTLTSRELDIIVTWASGGAPEGDPAKKPMPMAAHFPSTVGKPDLIVPMTTIHEVAAEKPQELFEVILATNLSVPRWVRAADLLPGTLTMVRRATISVVDGPVLALWEPGDDVSAAPDGNAFRLTAGARLRVEIFYKKPWQEEQVAKSDRSSVGLYFAKDANAEISSVTISAPKSGRSSDRAVSFTAPMPIEGRVLALRPQLDVAYSTMDVAAVTPSGERIPLLKLHAARPEWPRRYWLQQPVSVPAGSTIEVKGVQLTVEPSPASRAVNSPLEIGIDVAHP